MVKHVVKMRVKSAMNSVSPAKPTSVHVNNFLQNDTKLVNRFGYLIKTETLLGINRLPVLKSSRAWILFFHGYSACLALIFSFYALAANSENTFVSVIKYTNYFELIILMFFATFMQTAPINAFIDNMYEIDKKLVITNETKILNQSTSAKFLLLLSLTYCILEFIIFRMYLDEEWNPLFVLLYVALLAQDCEQVFFSMLLRSVGRRLQIIKAHVMKTLATENTPEILKKKSLSSAERLADRIDLDIGSLLELYEALHNCAQQVNSFMGVPMVAIFFCSGLSTTLLLMNLIKSFQSAEVIDMNLKLVCVYSVFRCVKYTFLVVFPCYYATEMKEHVQVIRKVLHEAINILDLDILDRRKVKTFLQMSRDNSFGYALCGVITLNMSMPLSYISICTTYLVIIIQFSKFFN